MIHFSHPANDFTSRPSYMDFGYSPLSSPSSRYWEALRDGQGYREQLRRENQLREHAEHLRQAREQEERLRREEALRSLQAQKEARRRHAMRERRYGGPSLFSPFFAYPGVGLDENEDVVEVECPTRCPSPRNRQSSQKIEIEGVSNPQQFTPPKPAAANQDHVGGNTESTQRSKADRNQAASTIQQQWRLYHARQASLSAVSRYRTQFDAQRSSFTFPPHLDFSPTASQPLLLYTSNNAPIHAYENDLTKLLTQLDGVDSVGSNKVRYARKSLVQAIEAELEKLESRKVDQWECQERIKRADEEKQIDMELDLVQVDIEDTESSKVQTNLLPASIPLPESPAPTSIPLPEGDEDLASASEHTEDARMENHRVPLSPESSEAGMIGFKAVDEDTLDDFVML